MLWISQTVDRSANGLLTRYVKLRVAHALGMPGTFSPSPNSKETANQRSRHASRHVRHARAVMHVGVTNPLWWGKRARHSRRMRTSQFYVSGKRPMGYPYGWVVTVLAQWAASWMAVRNWGCWCRDATVSCKVIVRRWFMYFIHEYSLILHHSYVLI